MRAFFIAIAAVLAGLAASPAYAVVDFATLYAASSGSISIPAEGATLTSVVTINQQTSVTGPGVLAITGDGKLIVEQPLTLQAVNVTWTKTIPSGVSGTTAIQVNGGGIALDATSVTLSITPPTTPDNSVTVPAWFLRVAGSGDMVLVENSTIRGTITYGAAFMYVDNADGYPLIRVTGSIFDFLHGGTYFNGGNGVEISNNAYNRVSLGNIVASSSDNLVVSGNTLTRSGNGTSGDALTIVGGANIRISRNSVFGASCYGMHIRGLAGTTMGPVYIDDNIIAGGSTTAFYFWGLSNGPIDGIWWRRNTATSNRGWGLVTQYASNITAEDNEFQTNAGTNNWPQHFFSTGTVLERWAYNRRGVPFSGSWTAQPYVFPYVNYPFQ